MKTKTSLRQNQDLLLKAVLLPPETALDCWREWQRKVDIEDIDPASFRLLPLLYKKLRAGGVEERELKPYAGIYRQTWVKNEIALNRLGSFLEIIEQAAAAPPLLLKGAALLLEFYTDSGLRMMNDVDLLVCENELQRIFPALTGRGWKSKQELPVVTTSLWRKTRRECLFINREGINVDLHWNFFAEAHYENDRLEELFRRGRPVTVGRGRARLPNPTDLFYHVIIHGTQNEAQRNLYWLVDAKLILEQKGSEIDWPLLMAMISKDRLTARFQEAVRQLAAYELDTLIPTAPRRLIQALDTSFEEQLEMFFVRNRYILLGDFPKVLFMARRYSRNFPSPRQRLEKMVEYFLCRWELEHLNQVPADFIRRLKKRWKMLRENRD